MIFNKDFSNRQQLSANKQMVKPPWKIIIDRLKVCFIIFIIYLILNLLHFGCPIKGFTGISCPGCGMTRAVLSALQLNIGNAFYYHPLFPITPIMFLLFLFDEFVPIKIKKTAWIIIICMFLIVYCYRLLFLQSTIVSIDIHNGLLLKLFHYINQAYHIIF